MQIPVLGIGTNVTLSSGTELHGPHRFLFGNDIFIGEGGTLAIVYERATPGPMLTIGDGVWCNKRCYFAAANEITIGKKVIFAPDVYVADSGNNRIERFNQQGGEAIGALRELAEREAPLFATGAEPEHGQLVLVLRPAADHVAREVEARGNEPAPVGEGRLHTFAVQYRAMGGWAAETPFVTAYIDLNEGDRMLTVLRGVDPKAPETIKIGSKVRVEFEPASDEVHIPFWRVIE